MLNPLLSSSLYQILGLSVTLSRKLYRARKLRKLDTSRDTKSLAGKACLTSPTPTDKTLPVFAIENRDDRNRIFTSRESIVQSYHAGRAKNDSVAEAATHRTPSTSHG